MRDLIPSAMTLCVTKESISDFAAVTTREVAS